MVIGSSTATTTPAKAATTTPAKAATTTPAKAATTTPAKGHGQYESPAPTLGAGLLCPQAVAATRRR
jgi:hypothetical protein